MKKKIKKITRVLEIRKRSACHHLEILKNNPQASDLQIKSLESYINGLTHGLKLLTDEKFLNKEYLYCTLELELRNYTDTDSVHCKSHCKAHTLSRLKRKINKYYGNKCSECNITPEEQKYIANDVQIVKKHLKP